MAGSVADTLPVCMCRGEVCRKAEAHSRHAHKVQRPQHAGAPARQGMQQMSRMPDDRPGGGGGYADTSQVTPQETHPTVPCMYEHTIDCCRTHTFLVALSRRLRLVQARCH